MITFFDTETTGVPKNYKAPATDLENWPRIIQLAFSMYQENGELFKSFKFLIVPDGWVVPNEKFWIDNGFSTEKCLQGGVPIIMALNDLIECINLSTLLVAHNMDFDLPVTAAEMLRAGVSAKYKPNKFCTMKATTDICRIPGQYGFKWPKLQELYFFLFKEDFTAGHDAGSDVDACAKCFFEMKKRGLITV